MYKKMTNLSFTIHLQTKIGWVVRILFDQTLVAPPLAILVLPLVHLGRWKPPQTSREEHHLRLHHLDLRRTVHFDLPKAVGVLAE